MSLNDKFGGISRKGGVLYYNICAHVPETQKCVTFVTFVTIWHKIQHEIFVNMQLRWFFSTFIAFFSDFVHFTFFYPNFCSNFAAQFKIIARSSHSHRVTIAHTYMCSQQAHMVFRADASWVLKLEQDFSTSKLYLQDYFWIQREILVILLNFVL